MGGTKSGVSCFSSATMSLARCDGHSLPDAARMSWSVLQERVYRNKISDVGELKRHIKNEFMAEVNHAVLLNVLLTSVTSVYALVFVIEANV